MKVAEFVRGRQLAILPEIMRSLCDAAERGEDMPEFAARDVSSEGAAPSRIAVMPIFGMITQHQSRYGTSSVAFGREYARMIADPTVATIVIEANSGGGEVYGTPELANLIYQGRKLKRTIAHVHGMAASAMYWIATAASEVYITPSGEVGSIGVLTWHEDVSGLEEKMGVKTELIAVPEAKIEGHPFGPLSEEVRERIRGELAETHGTFMAAVARHRGVGIDAVRNGFGQGRMVGAKQAKAEGMVDDIATFDEVIQNELKRIRGRSRAAARERALKLADA